MLILFVFVHLIYLVYILVFKPVPELRNCGIKNIHLLFKKINVQTVLETVVSDDSHQKIALGNKFRLGTQSLFWVTETV